MVILRFHALQPGTDLLLQNDRKYKSEMPWKWKYVHKYRPAFQVTSIFIFIFQEITQKSCLNWVQNDATVRILAKNVHFKQTNLKSSPKSV